MRIVLPVLFLFTGFVMNSCEVGRQGKRKDILAENMDTTVSPGRDFFLYANGGWMNRTTIPADESSWGIGHMVQEDIYKRLRQINEKALNARDGIDKKIGDFWFSAMDSASIDKQGIDPVKPLLQQVDGLKNTRDLLNLIAQWQTMAIFPLFSQGVSQDSKNSDSMALYFLQGGLGLEDRDYYFKTDTHNIRIREKYRTHLVNMLAFAGQDSAAARAGSLAIMNLETQLATASRKLEDLRDPYRNYNKMTVAQFSALTPGINWTEWMPLAGLPATDSVIVGQPEFFKAVNRLLNEVSMDNWKQYLRWNLMNSLAPYLSKQISDENFDFYSRTMRDVQQPRPRWKEVLRSEENVMGEALGHLFVDEYFNAAAKKRYSDMVESVRTALKERIEKLDWMSDSTKKKALKKLAAMVKKVGYPDKWKDFSGLEITRGPYVQNMINARSWWYKDQVNKLGKPVDRSVWEQVYPQTYNAYYNPSNNEIVLPAGIFLVPGYRDEELDDALVYGYAAASTIGHEITHGFDDDGRQFDEFGNLKNWWSASDDKLFRERAAVLVRQFNAYTPFDSLHINGQATLGENIADLGGVLLGWDAFVKTDFYKKGEKISNLTPGQRFFLGYSLGWLYKLKPAQIRHQLMTDYHSPAQYRVNGPFANVDAFYEVFNIRPGEPMYRADSIRVKIW